MKTPLRINGPRSRDHIRSICNSIFECFTIPWPKYRYSSYSDQSKYLLLLSESNVLTAAVAVATPPPPSSTLSLSLSLSKRIYILMQTCFVFTFSSKYTKHTSRQDYLLDERAVIFVFRQSNSSSGGSGCGTHPE